MKLKTTINVALADDHAILRKGVAEIISRFDGLEVMMEAANGRDLLQKLSVATILPDVCIIDINMPEMNGYETARAVKQSWPSVRLLALSMYDTELNIIKMLRSGACGYVLKDSDPRDLETAIRAVHTDGFYHSELVTSRMLHILHDKTGVPELSARELQFLGFCCSEYTYKEIADMMYLSVRTIDGYREVLFQKLNITTRTGLVMYAIKTGIAGPK